MYSMQLYWQQIPVCQSIPARLAAPIGQCLSLLDPCLASGAAEFEIRRSKNVCVELPTSTLVHPRSQYDGFAPPLPPSKERDAVASLLDATKAQRDVADKDFVEFELEAFCFYIDTAYYQCEMRPLQYMATKIAHDRFYFDGVLRVGEVRHYVQKVEVTELPIGNYGVSNPTVGGQIWVRSRLNANREVYYRLQNAATEYARYYTPFLWVADLAKHLVDYSASMIEQGRQVGIGSFQEHFIQWLLDAHGGSPEFQDWRRQHPSADYRTSVVANIEFFWKEMNGVLGGDHAQSLLLFRETMYISAYKQQQDRAPAVPMVVRGDEEEPPTIVTPYIQDCFGHMAIGTMLRTVGGPAAATSNGVAEVDTPTELPAQAPSYRRGPRHGPSFLAPEVIDRIKAGDTISTPRDGDTTDTKWQNMASKGAIEDHRWFGLVQQVHPARDGSRSFDVTWFYRPVETPCCIMKYPWPNELFLSDHCTCEEGAHALVREHDVLGVHEVDWFGGPHGGKGEFFVRQIYMVESRRWITLRKSHMRCSHGPPRPRHKPGETVLATLSPVAKFSEPYEVVKVFKQNDKPFVRLRRLLRRTQVDPQAGAAPNELVYTDQLVVTKPERIIGPCLVRFFRSGQPIPTPYDRDGTGNVFFITHRLDEALDMRDAKCVPFEGDFPTSLRQSFDPGSQTFRKLRGMDLFCGSGNFGRGLEDGGAVDMLWANDIWDRAIHTYMANSPDPESTSPFLGSVDDLLRLALEGKYSENVPRPGEVDFIAAGSPCPGFSLLTQDKSKLNQIKNRSLVASFASFVDFYRPKYGILENVSSIVQAHHNRTEDVLSQLFCAIVGMGYQTQLVIGDAWSYGAPQSRTRVFLYFAAPGLRLPEAPAPTHSHPEKTPKRGLGVICNGEPFVSRSFGATPFKHATAGGATAGLPSIGDGKAEPSTAFPDHRVVNALCARTRHQIAAIPTHPHGLKFATAWRGGHGVMTAAERALFPPQTGNPRTMCRVSAISDGWRRVVPRDLFQTVTTRCQPTDARASTGLHWRDDRPLTVREVRRAQGFREHEVLLGSLADQWKLVGNSVARQMAVALGVRLREAWAGEGDRGGSGVGGRGAAVALVQSDPTSDSRSSSPGSAAMGAGRTTTPGSTVSESVEATGTVAAAARNGGGVKKRELSQTAAAAELELAMRSPKMQRLPSPRVEPPDANGSGNGLGPGPGGDAGLAGPTVVRLWTPSGMGSDGRGPDDDLD
ncbi:S-adenosyl-L-methionine-dependent methyltransferase [Trichocladium antarcticum]|uniref:DNA (cytosine-5-)-methyltransferase n=1 Tax=Trichocladium antarcticum TaxID=1450529 RepID=A0AAN6UG76_9PEZI|nr:S-adenosyl-L-methionine-dependent methyltransferase [Trichocladium antarcticum]